MREDAPTATEVSELECVLHDQKVLRLDIPMENAISVHMVNRLE